jgi:hypothetical protein
VNEMKKVLCVLNIFDFEQTVYIIDDDTGERDIVALAPAEELTAVISAICNEENIYNVILSGNLTYSNLIKDSITTYSNLNYKNNKINVEVVK